ncbi:hypothetical protein ACLB2K_022484 [Fragaria x ananassa]
MVGRKVRRRSAGDLAGVIGVNNSIIKVSNWLLRVSNWLLRARGKSGDRNPAVGENPVFGGRADADAGEVLAVALGEAGDDGGAELGGGWAGSGAVVGEGGEGVETEGVAAEAEVEELGGAFGLGERGGGGEGGEEEVVQAYSQNPQAHKAITTKSGETALHIAVLDGQEERVEDLVKLVSLEELKLQNLRGNTPLHFAAAQGNVRMCKCIAKDRSLVDILNKDKETPLFLATLHGILVDELNVEEADDFHERVTNTFNNEKARKYPEQYETGINFLLVFWKMARVFGMGINQIHLNIKHLAMTYIYDLRSVHYIFRPLVTFSLNALSGRHHKGAGVWVGDWDSRNAYDFINYTVSKGYQINSWELGNELCGKGVGASVGAEQYGKDLIKLKHIVNQLYNDSHIKPALVGPGGFFDQKWFTTLLQVSGSGVVDVVTQHIFNLGPDDGGAEPGGGWAGSGAVVGEGGEGVETEGVAAEAEVEELGGGLVEGEGVEVVEREGEGRWVGVGFGVVEREGEGR